MPSFLQRSVRRRRRLGGRMRRQGSGLKSWLKKTGIISGLASAVPIIGPALGNTIGSYGYGHRRRRLRKGRGIWDNFKRGVERRLAGVIEKGIKKGHEFLKRNRVYSSRASAISPALGNLLRQKGYGRRRQGGAKMKTQPYYSTEQLAVPVF